MDILILGAGQLARMMSLAGAPLNINTLSYDIRSRQILHPLTLHVYPQSLQEAIGTCDFITAEFEHIPDDVLTQCAVSEKFYPGKQAIKTGSDRSIEKSLLNKINVPSAPFQLITNRADFNHAIEHLGTPLVIKTCQEGYDGKGQWRLEADSNKEKIWTEMSHFLDKADQQPRHSMIAEKMILFQREVSLIGARDHLGNTAIYPITENVHTNGVLTLSVVKSNTIEIEQQAIDIFNKLVSEMSYVGVLAIEFFDIDGTLIVNEIAPRVHNSGHWTQQGTLCSQFENHLRAVAGLALGNTKAIGVSAMINVLGQPTIPKEVLSISGVSTHWYGKTCGRGRKMGHINVVAETEEGLGDKLITLSRYLTEKDYPGVYLMGTQLVGH